jgi:hypothetical protein
MESVIANMSTTWFNARNRPSGIGVSGLDNSRKRGIPPQIERTIIKRV